MNQKYNPMMNFFIFVNSDSFDLDDKKVRSHKIASYRLAHKTYPLYFNTRLKKYLKSNDAFIFYLAGTQASKTKRFIAYGRIQSIEKPKTYSEDDIHLSRPIEQVVVLKSIVNNKSLSIYKVKDRLSFVTKKKKWGPSMQGGIIKITKEDYDLIINEMS